MSNNEQWGPGNKANAEPFATVKVGDERLELFFGEHPHSRQDNRTYARDSSGFIAGFSGHRAPVKIEIEEYNYLKSSGMSGDEYRRGCKTKVYIDGVHVYTLPYGRDYGFALSRLPDIVTRLQEHPVRFWSEDVQKLEGRKVRYRDQAAVVQRWSAESGVLVVPEGKERFRAPGYANGKDDEEEGWGQEYGAGLYCDVLSPDVYWFRD